MTRTPMEEELVADGRVAWIQTRGRTSGEPRPVAVGYVMEADGSLLISASDGSSDWAQNLAADPACEVTVGGSTYDALAEPLDREAHVATVRALILRYGTPSEDLGRGPSFRLRRVVHA